MIIDFATTIKTDPLKNTSPLWCYIWIRIARWRVSSFFLSLFKPIWLLSTAASRTSWPVQATIDLIGRSPAPNNFSLPIFPAYSVIEMQPSMRFLFGLVLPLIFYVLPTLSMNPQEPHEPTESSAVAPRAARTSIPPIIYEEALFKSPSVPFDPKKLYYIFSSTTCHTSWSTALWKKPLILFSQNKRHAEP